MIGLIVILSVLVLTFASYFIIKKTLKVDFFEFVNSKLLQKLPIYSKKWYFWPILFVCIYAIVLILYALFAYPLGSPDCVLYAPDDPSIKLSEQAKIARSFVGSLNYTYISIFGVVITLLVLGVLLYLFSQKKFKLHHLIIAILVLGVVGRITYGFLTDNIFTRQHDTWSSNGAYGHYGITMSIYYNFIPPEMKSGYIDGVLTPSLDFSYQLYHPKFTHYLNAIFMHINSLFLKGDAQWVLYQSIRVLTITISTFTLIASYLIFKELTNNKTFITIGTSFVAFSPLMFRLSAMSNNDPTLYLFLTLTILFLIKFYEKQNFTNIIGVAVSIGLAMSSKLSGAIIAIPTAIIFLIILIKMIKEKQLKKAVGLFFVFILICFPLGLFWPIFNYIKYDQPFNYVFNNLNQGLLIPDTYSYVDKFLTFPVNQYFSNLWMQLWNNYKEFPQDYNLYTSMLKSAIFGEFSYGGPSLIFASVLFVINFILAIALVMIAIYVVINLIIKKDYLYLFVFTSPIILYLSLVMFKGNELWMYIVLGGLIFLLVYLFIINFKKIKDIHKYKVDILMSAICLTFMVSYFIFQLQYPYGCTQDFRYIGLFFLVSGYYFARFVTTNKNKNINIVFLVIVVTYMVSSYLMYISLGFR